MSYMLFLVCNDVTINLKWCFFIIFIVSFKSSVSIIFTLKIAPIVERTTFGLKASAVSFDTIIEDIKLKYKEIKGE